MLHFNFTFSDFPSVILIFSRALMARLNYHNIIFSILSYSQNLWKFHVPEIIVVYSSWCWIIICVCIQLEMVNVFFRIWLAVISTACRHQMCETSIYTDYHATNKHCVTFCISSWLLQRLQYCAGDRQTCLLLIIMVLRLFTYCEIFMGRQNCRDRLRSDIYICVLSQLAYVNLS